MKEIISLYTRLCREGGLTLPIAFTVLGLKTLATLAEGFGLALLVPVFEMADSESLPDGERSAVWRVVAELFEFAGIKMSVTYLLVFIVALVIVRQILVYTHRVYLVSVQQQMAATLRDKGVQACFDARLDYHDVHTTGAIVNDLAQETQRAVGVAYSVLSAAGNIVLTTIYLVGMSLATGWIVLVVFLGTSVLAPFMRRLLGRTRHESEVLAAANRAFSDQLLERLRAIRLLKLTRSEAREGAFVAKAVDNARRSTVALARMQSTIPLVVEPAGALLLAGLFYGGVSILGLPLELVLVVILIIVRLIPVIQEIAKAAQVFLAGIGSLRFVVERFDTAREAVETNTGTVALSRQFKGNVTLENVVYRYRQEGERLAALDHLTVTFPAAQFSAIVGPSGAGKSTLIDLIPKLRIPQSGTIKIDDVSIEKLDTGTLRELIAFVPQSPDMLAGTIGGHIKFGNSDVTDDGMQEAARLAGLHSFIAGLPDGYDTRLGEAGVGLSGGQRQRLDVARAIARKAQILILDEPASNLDPESEEEFRKVLRRIRDETDTTILLIAHRFASIQNADHIVVIEAGRAVASGTHAELLGTCDWYRRGYEASYISGDTDRKAS